MAKSDTKLKSFELDGANKFVFVFLVPSHTPDFFGNTTSLTNYCGGT